MSIKVGVITNVKSTTGKYRFRLVGHHDGVQNEENEKWGYPHSSTSQNMAGVGEHSVFHEGTRVMVNEFGPDGSFGIIGAFPRAGSGQGGGGEYDSDTSVNDVNYKHADTPIDFKNPQKDGGDNEMDVPSGRYNKYAGGKGFDSSSYQYPGLAPYKNKDT